MSDKAALVVLDKNQSSISTIEPSLESALEELGFTGRPLPEELGLDTFLKAKPEDATRSLRPKREEKEKEIEEITSANLHSTFILPKPPDIPNLFFFFCL